MAHVEKQRRGQEKSTHSTETSMAVLFGTESAVDAEAEDFVEIERYLVNRELGQ